MANGRVKRKKRALGESGTNSGEDILAKVKGTINSYVAVVESRARLTQLLSDRKRMAREASALRLDIKRAAGSSTQAKARRAVVKGKLRALNDSRQELNAQIMGLQSQIYQSELAQQQSHDSQSDEGEGDVDILHAMHNMTDARRVVGFLMKKVKTSIDTSRTTSSVADQAAANARSPSTAAKTSDEVTAQAITRKIEAKEVQLQRIKDLVADMKREFKATKLALRSTQRSLEKQFQNHVDYPEIAKEAARVAITAQLEGGKKLKSTSDSHEVRRSSRTRKGSVNYAELDGSDSEWEPDSEEDLEPDTPAPKSRKRRSSGGKSTPKDADASPLVLKSSNDVESLTVKQLKDELKSRGEKVSGRKAELVERLCVLLEFAAPSAPATYDAQSDAENKAPDTNKVRMTDFCALHRNAEHCVTCRFCSSPSGHGK